MAVDEAKILALALGKVSLGDDRGAIKTVEDGLADAPQDLASLKKIIADAIAKSAQQLSTPAPEEKKKEDKAPISLVDELGKKIEEIVELQLQVVAAVKKLFGPDADTKDFTSGVVEADKDKINLFSEVASAMAAMFEKFAEIGLRCESEKKDDVHSFAIYFPKGYEGERDFLAMNEDHFRALAEKCREQEKSAGVISAEKDVAVSVIGSAPREKLEEMQASKRKEFAEKLSGEQSKSSSFVELVAGQKSEAARGGGVGR